MINNNYSIEKDVIVEHTPLLKKSYKGAIEKKTEKGIQRSCFQAGFLTHLPLLDTYFELNQFSDIHKKKICLNFMSDQKGNILSNLETVHWITESTAYKNGKRYSATEALDNLKSIGALILTTDPNYKKGVSRESKIKQLKKMSNIAFEVLTYYIDNDIFDLHDDIYNVYTIKDTTQYHENEIRQKISKLACESSLIAQSPSRAERGWRSIFYTNMIKKWQKSMGLSYDFLNLLTCLICPGYQKGRRQSILTKLLVKYNIHHSFLNPLLSKDNTSQVAVQVVPPGTSSVRDASLEDDCRHLAFTEGLIDNGWGDAMNGFMYGLSYDNPIYTPLSPPTPTPPTPSPPTPLSPPTLATPSEAPRLAEPLDRPSLASETHLELEARLVEPVEAPLELLKDPIKGDIRGDELRQQAVEVLLKNEEYINTTYNEALCLKVLQYSPQDAIDDRQINSMLVNGTLPQEYRLLSASSPRVYGVGTDNLFYSRKELRLKAMEGFGFKDVDIQNCHVQIALALWGNRLPVLRSCLDQEISLWDFYADLYKENSVPFYKSLIKTLHHATFLSGGQPAYQRAFHIFNKSNKKLNKIQFDEILKVFKNSSIYKEIKGLFKSLRNEWSGKILVCPTGESFLVEKTNWYLKKKKGIDTGNFPTALSAYLQSFEVLLLSDLIVRCQELFLPILWQHDGLTIKCLYSNTVELMQECINQFCTLYLNGRNLKLVSTDL